MIIDFHIHPFCKEATWPDLKKVAETMWGKGTQKSKFMLLMLKNLAEKTSIEDYIQLMDKLAIRKAVIVSFNISTAYGITLVTNDDVANLVDRFPKRLIGFGSVDVPGEKPVEELDYAINSLELSGIKLVPPVQKFNISDPKYDPLWSKMEEINVPLWTHGGHQVSTQGSIAKYGHPMLIDEVALNHPNLKIIIGHMGTPWFWDTYSVVLRHENVYVDISAHPELYNHFPWDAYEKYNIKHKILFASDHPLAHWNQIISAVENMPISDAFKADIYSRNAEKLLEEIG